jgi:hypothetical protein
MKASDLFQALIDGSVDFVLIGGLAVQLHGHMRMTYDIDLVLAMNDENLIRYVEVAKLLGLKPVAPIDINALKDTALIDLWHKEKGMLAFALREPGLTGTVVDVLVRPVVPYERLAEDAFEGEFLGFKIKIASIDHLIEMKRIANRPKDLQDIAALEKMKQGLDPND